MRSRACICLHLEASDCATTSDWVDNLEASDCTTTSDWINHML